MRQASHVKQWRWLALLGMILFCGCQSEAFDQIKPTPEQRQQLYSLGGTEALGNTNGKVTMVIISSYDCHYCREDYPVVRQFISSHPDLKVMYKSYLAFGLDTQVAAQYAALAAAKQQQFVAMNEALFLTERPLSQDTMEYLAKRLKLNSKRFLSDMRSQAVADQVINNTTLIDQLGIQGIPTVIMADSRVIHDANTPQYIQVGSVNIDKLTEMYEEVVK